MLSAINSQDLILTNHWLNIYIYLLLEKAWKRMVTKVCYVGEGFTRKPPKYERFIRPMVRHILFAIISFSHGTHSCEQKNAVNDFFFFVKPYLFTS